MMFGAFISRCLLVKPCCFPSCVCALTAKEFATEDVVCMDVPVCHSIRQSVSQLGGRAAGCLIEQLAKHSGHRLNSIRRSICDTLTGPECCTTHGRHTEVVTCPRYPLIRVRGECIHMLHLTSLSTHPLPASLNISLGPMDFPVFVR